MHRAYLKQGQKERNLPFEAVKGLYDGTQKLYIHASREKAIVDAVNWAKERRNTEVGTSFMVMKLVWLQHLLKRT